MIRSAVLTQITGVTINFHGPDSDGPDFDGPSFNGPGFDGPGFDGSTCKIVICRYL